MKKEYLKFGVKRCLVPRFINEQKANQSDFKELREYEFGRTNKNTYLLPIIQECKRWSKSISEVSPNYVD